MVMQLPENIKYILIGSTMLDTIAVGIERFPFGEIEETLPAHRGIYARAGGVALNVASQLAYLGDYSHDIGLLTHCNPEDQLIEESLAASGVVLLQTREHPSLQTGHCICLTLLGANPTRHFIPCEGEGNAITGDDVLRLTDSLTPHVKRIHLTNLGLSPAHLDKRIYRDKDCFLDRARKLGIKISASTVSAKDFLSTAKRGGELQHLTSKLDWLITNANEASWLLEDDINVGNDVDLETSAELSCLVREEYKSSGVAVTCGHNGCAATTGAGTFSAAAIPNDNVRDATGAGDAWAAGFLLSFDNGLSLRECLRKANTLASKSLSNIGGSGLIMDKGDFDRC
jgi:sugar/nucleoside kinase (ribokinase family)